MPISEILPDNLLEHDAVRAWNSLRTAPSEPNAVQVLKRKTKSAVYRLAGLNAGDSIVIAKRCYAATAEVERVIYQQVLPRLVLPALRCYGYVREPAGDYCWLFLDEAAGLEYSAAKESNRVLAGRWLGALHCASRDCGRRPGLPDRDCAYYRQELCFVVERIEKLQTNPVVPEEDVLALQSLVAQCQLVEAHWEELQDRCRAMPHTVVHGDFVSKNVRIRSTNGDPALLVFDWELAGWGVPATDFSRFLGGTVSPDLEAYCAAMEERGYPMDRRVVKRVAECGGFFRLLDDMAWACQCIVNDAYIYLEKPISCLRRYEMQLAPLLQCVGWTR